jgi:hypothetical protein
VFSLSLSSPAVPLSSQTVRAKLDSLAAKAMQAPTHAGAFINIEFPYGALLRITGVF